MCLVCLQLRLAVDKGHGIENVYMGKTSHSYSITEHITSDGPW